MSGRAAAHLLGLLKGTAPRPEVTAPTERRVNGVATRRSRQMDPRDATTWRGIPVTGPAPVPAKLRHVLRGGVRVALSKLEARFLARLGEAGLPLPETNRPAGGRRVDCRWPAERVTVELDSYRYHHSRHAWELDRRREREAHARGDQFRRYTYGDVVEAPAARLAELRAMVPRRRPAERS